MADQQLGDATPSTLHYATPVQRLKRVRPVTALVGGMFLVLVAAITLLLGFIVIAEYQGYLGSGPGVILTFACVFFSAICLFCGLPLIYRGSRGDD